MCAQRIWWHFLSFFGGPSWDRPAHLGKWNAPDTHTRGNTWTHLGGETRKRNPLKIENDHSVTIITSKPPPLQPNRWFERAHTWYWPNHQHPVCVGRERESCADSFLKLPHIFLFKKILRCWPLWRPSSGSDSTHNPQLPLFFSPVLCNAVGGVHDLPVNVFSLSLLCLYMVSSSEREKEKREEREKRFCVCGNLSLWFSLGGWCIQMKAECRFPQDVGVSSPVFPVARKKVLNKISL